MSKARNVTVKAVASWVALVAGVILVLAGTATWVTVQNQLSAENITVAEDASCAAGDQVDGPIAAFCQADIINQHALEATGGKTYAELERDDPLRQVAASASYLRNALFTSVVAFGVAALAFGLGIVVFLLGLAVREPKQA